jgi:hypothetical protein
MIRAWSPSNEPRENPKERWTLFGEGQYRLNLETQNPGWNGGLIVAAPLRMLKAYTEVRSSVERHLLRVGGWDKGGVMWGGGDNVVLV